MWTGPQASRNEMNSSSVTPLLSRCGKVGIALVPAGEVSEYGVACQTPAHATSVIRWYRSPFSGSTATSCQLLARYRRCMEADRGGARFVQRIIDRLPERVLGVEVCDEQRKRSEMEAKGHTNAKGQGTNSNEQRLAIFDMREHEGAQFVAGSTVDAGIPEDIQAVLGPDGALVVGGLWARVAPPPRKGWRGSNICGWRPTCPCATARSRQQPRTQMLAPSSASVSAVPCACQASLKRRTRCVARFVCHLRMVPLRLHVVVATTTTTRPKRTCTHSHPSYCLKIGGGGVTCTTSDVEMCAASCARGPSMLGRAKRPA